MTARNMRDTAIFCAWVAAFAIAIGLIGGAMFWHGMHYESVFFLLASAAVGGFVLGLRHAGKKWALEHPEEAYGAQEGAWRAW